ncbi:HDOD domain protein [Planctomycetes bacterium Pan216]|uniref:HDOD domain protein n=1 Tax=Kolteria novifilia TaxID=2527975 RepID=A0A518BCD8_9BACT|nr:HDOD domain protein [Planctomycetes bacterium Pan216]
MSPVSAGIFVEKFRKLGTIPTLPQAATRALAIANDPKCTISDFARVIESDPALATSLLKLVNSSYYAGNSRISNLTMAITRLGLRETQNMILAVSVRSVFRWMPKDQQEERDRLWRHSALTAVLCRHINEKLGFDFNGEEFSSGLAHDLGRIMLAVGYPDVFCKLSERESLDEGILLQDEESLLGFNHTDLGSWLANMWNLSEEMVEAIQYHHHPDRAPKYSILCSIVSIGEEMANFMEEHRTVEGIDLSNNPGWILLRNRWQAIDELDPSVFATAVMIEAMDEAEALVVVDAEVTV